VIPVQPSSSFLPARCTRRVVLRDVFGDVLRGGVVCGVLSGVVCGVLSSLGPLAGCAAGPAARRDDDAPSGAGRAAGTDAGTGDAHPLRGLTDFEGQALAALPALGTGQIVLVDFWASWCAPCRQGFRYLDQLYRTWLARGLQMVAISVDDDPAAARRFAAMFRPRFPLAWDPDADVRERFAVYNLPTTVLFDGEGNVVVRNTGFDLGDHRALEEHVRRLLT
jgi:thiol-disulfide isomerase/thioredoxin